VVLVVAITEPALSLARRHYSPVGQANDINVFVT
jgi:hypothetical protein